ncbi:MAG: DsrE family protein [Hyphomicrobiaceae bacterium]|nr:DsrE family protein [Hyphomicrobiaceae bacterium]
MSRDNLARTGLLALGFLAPGFLAIVLALAAVGTGATAGDNGRYGKQKVVYHINEDGGEASKAHLRALNNIQNHINAVGAENMELKIVLHGDGVNVLKDAVSNLRLQGQVVNLKDQKVSFAICNNTLVQRKIDYQKDLFEVDKADIVPSGVAELSHLQQQGYTYVKP